jgi:hypothetical protein
VRDAWRWSDTKIPRIRVFSGVLVPNRPLQHRSEERASALPDPELPAGDGFIGASVGPVTIGTKGPGAPPGARARYCRFDPRSVQKLREKILRGNGAIPVSELVSQVTRLLMDKSRGTWPCERLRSGQPRRWAFVYRARLSACSLCAFAVSQHQDHVLLLQLLSPCCWW